MDTFIVVLIVLGAVIALLNSFVKTFKSGNESPCGCGSACAGCEVESGCTDKPADPKRIA